MERPVLLDASHHCPSWNSEDNGGPGRSSQLGHGVDAAFGVHDAPFAMLTLRVVSQDSWR